MRHRLPLLFLVLTSRHAAGERRPFRVNPRWVSAFPTTTDAGAIENLHGGADNPLLAADTAVTFARNPDVGANIWLIPLLAAIFSFSSFPHLTSAFHHTVSWASGNTWLRETQAEVNLQADVVTQVVNGPVITSISVLFATLVSVTIDNLHSRQKAIQQSFILEVQSVRQLQQLLESTAATACLNQAHRTRALVTVNKHADELLMQVDGALMNATYTSNPHTYIESHLLGLLDCCNEMYALRRTSPVQEHIITQMHALTTSMLQERKNRWLALRALHFPAVHYMTLALLAISIGVAFLVATDEAEFIFLWGLPIRILWTLLFTSFTALAVVCSDLAQPFGGAYRVSGDSPYNLDLSAVT